MFTFPPTHSELKGMKGHGLLYWPLTEGVYNTAPLSLHRHESAQLISNPRRIPEKKCTETWHINRRNSIPPLDNPQLFPFKQIQDTFHTLGHVHTCTQVLKETCWRCDHGRGKIQKSPEKEAKTKAKKAINKVTKAGRGNCCFPYWWREAPLPLLTGAYCSWAVLPVSNVKKNWKWPLLSEYFHYSFPN